MGRQGTDSAAGAVMAAGHTPIPGITPQQRRRAVANVCDALGYADTERTHASTASAEVLLALFGRRRTRRRGHRGPDGPPAGDPSRSQHPPEDIGAWRAQVAAWGRENGFPDASSRHVLEADLVAAYRAAHAGGER